MFKKIAFLTPRPDLTRDAFLRYWREVHGPTVARAPGYALWRDRYVQNHIRGPGLGGPPFPFAGMAEFWLPSANEDRYALSPTYRDHVRPDELNFIDMDRTISMTATEHVIRSGQGQWKLVVLVAPQPASARVDGSSSLLERASAAAAELPDIISGYALNLVQPGSLRLPGARRGEGPRVGAIHEIRFATSDNVNSSAINQTIARMVRTIENLESLVETQSFLAEEITFFNNSVNSSTKKRF